MVRMRINFEMEEPDKNGLTLLRTPCPHGKIAKVCSYNCTRECRSSKHYNLKEQWVDCIFPEERDIDDMRINQKVG